MNKMKRLCSFLLGLMLFGMSIAFPVKADTSWQYRSNKEICVNQTNLGQIPVLENDYKNNLYISLRGVAYALRDTGKAFAPETIERRLIKLLPKTNYGQAPSPWNEEQTEERLSLVLRRNQLFWGESERKYSSFTTEGADGGMDAFLSPAALALMLDVNIVVEDDRISIDTKTPFERTPAQLEEAGCFQGIHAFVLGDATTGDLFYEYDGDRQVAIASTTKLMTYFVAKDAVASGQCSLTDKVTISKKAAELSESADGTTPMTAGQKIPLSELLYGLLLPSSNECGLAIAEHISTTMEDFVVRMNEKAKALGMENTTFVNCHGLPLYQENTTAAKIQNQMTARDMFVMASALVNAYPEVLDITSLKNYKLETLNQTVKNTNAVLYNMPEVKGLKTGYTNKAGSCLVQCIPLETDGEKHQIISVLFGAEEDEVCFLISEMMAGYAKRELPNLLAMAEENRQVINEETESIEPETKPEGVPENPELVIQKILEGALAGQ